MSLTASTMLELGTYAPEFALPDVVTDHTVTLSSMANQQVLVVIFLCNHCKFVRHVRSEIAQVARDYSDRPVAFVGISANDRSQYPEDAPDQLKAMAQSVGFTFPVCYDETQTVAKAYSAACTPDFFVFDGDRRLLYRGQLDDSRPNNNRPVTGSDLRAAIDAGLAGSPVVAHQRPSMGCNIKWKPGKAPDYYSPKLGWKERVKQFLRSTLTT